MPKLSGIDTLTVIRKSEQFKDIPVILLTASTDPLDVVKANELNVADYIRKPFIADDLIARVRKSLPHHHLS